MTAFEENAHPDQKLQSNMDTSTNSPVMVLTCQGTGFGFPALPDRIFYIRGTDCIGKKKSKDRLNVSLACNMLGEFDKPLVIEDEA